MLPCSSSSTSSRDKHPLTTPFHTFKRGVTHTYGTRETLTYGIGVTHTPFEATGEGQKTGLRRTNRHSPFAVDVC